MPWPTARRSAAWGSPGSCCSSAATGASASWTPAWPTCSACASRSTARPARTTFCELLGGTLRQIFPARQTDFLPYLGPLIGLVVMTLVLQLLPRLHVKFRHAFLGAGISTALWWLAKWGFGVYQRHTMTWGIMYGSLLGIVAGLTFLYYSCAILLLGAEITAAFYRHETGATTVPSWLRKAR